MILKRVGPLSAAKVAGTLYALLGLLIGAIFALVALAGPGITSGKGASLGFLAPLFGVGAIIILPITPILIGAQVWVWRTFGPEPATGAAARIPSFF